MITSKLSLRSGFDYHLPCSLGCSPVIISQAFRFILHIRLILVIFLRCSVILLNIPCRFCFIPRSNLQLIDVPLFSWSLKWSIAWYVCCLMYTNRFNLLTGMYSQYKRSSPSGRHEQSEVWRRHFQVNLEVISLADLILDKQPYWV